MRSAMLLICCVLAVAVLTCDDGNKPTGGLMRLRPSNPSPANGAVDQPLQLVLSWVCSPQSPGVGYELYFGTTNPPPLLHEFVPFLHSPVYDLVPNTRYFWRVVFRSENEVWLSSPVWSFRTGEHSTYPLNPEYAWSYAGRIFRDNFRPAELEEQFDDVVTYSSRVYPRGRQVIYPGGEEKETWLLECHTNGFGDLPVEEISKGWYANEPDGLYEYAYEAGSNYALPKPWHGIATMGGLTQTLLNCGALLPAISSSVDLTFDTAKVFHYPFGDPISWVYRDVTGLVKIYKEYIGEEEVSVAAGTFDCHVIRWRWEGGNGGFDNLTVYEFVSEIGLVRREIRVTDLTLYDVGHPEGLGLADFHQVVELDGLLHLDYVPWPDDSVKPER